MAKKSSVDIIKISNNGEYAPIEGAYLGSNNSLPFPSIADEPGYQNGCGVVLELSGQRHVVVGLGGFVV
jgi:hypothetical protein